MRQHAWCMYMGLACLDDSVTQCGRRVYLRQHSDSNACAGIWKASEALPACIHMACTVFCALGRLQQQCPGLLLIDTVCIAWHDESARA